MSQQIPRTIRAITLSHYSKPADYGISTLATPEITKPGEILIKVHAASISPADVKMANGMTKLFSKDEFPYQIGKDVSGTIVSVGTAVQDFKPGDAVFALAPFSYRGTLAEYALLPSTSATLKPDSMSFTVAGSLPLAGLAALQAVRLAEETLPGGLKGKTVLITAGLSGTGHIAVQLAKNVFGAGKVITTLSTGKIQVFKEIFDTSVAVQIVDYTKSDVIKAIGAGEIDFFFDNIGSPLSMLPVMKKGGLILSITTIPPGANVKKSWAPDLPWYWEMVFDVTNWFIEFQMKWKGILYSNLMIQPDRTGLKDLAEWVSAGKVKPVIGSTASLDDLDGIKAGAQQILDAQGGVGKFVVVMEKD